MTEISCYLDLSHDSARLVLSPAVHSSFVTYIGELVAQADIALTEHRDELFDETEIIINTNTPQTIAATGELIMKLSVETIEDRLPINVTKSRSAYAQRYYAHHRKQLLHSVC